MRSRSQAAARQSGRPSLRVALRMTQTWFSRKSSRDWSRRSSRSSYCCFQRLMLAAVTPARAEWGLAQELAWWREPGGGRLGSLRYGRLEACATMTDLDRFKLVDGVAK